MADTLQQLLRTRADLDTIAVKYGDASWTWREHIAEASRAGRGPHRRSPTRRDHCTSACCMGNTPDMLTALAAAGLGGYVLCGINTTRRGDALARDIARVDCQLLLTDPDHRHLLDGLDLPGVTRHRRDHRGVGRSRSAAAPTAGAAPRSAAPTTPS